MRPWSYDLFFEAAAAGLPVEVNVDAFSFDGLFVFLSFDRDLSIGGAVIADEDVVFWDGSDFYLTFDGTAAGLPVGADLDAMQVLPDGTMLLSFDISVTVSGITAADEDVLAYDSCAVWSLAWDGSAQDTAWGSVDVDALSADEFFQDPIFSDGFEIGNTGNWDATAPLSGFAQE